MLCIKLECLSQNVLLHKFLNLSSLIAKTRASYSRKYNMLNYNSNNEYLMGSDLQCSDLASRMQAELQQSLRDVSKVNIDLCN
jgi:hypothetical protein